MTKTLRFLVLVVTTVVVSAQKVLFNGYSVYRTKVVSPEEFKLFNDIKNNELYSVWNDGPNENQQVDIMVPPEAKPTFTALFPDAEIYIEDVQELIDNERPPGILKVADREMSWTDYHTYDEIYKWFNELTEEFPNIVKLINVGKSYEKRDIFGVHVSYKPENKNKAIWLEGGMHAREWIGVATVTYQLNQLLRSQNTTIREIAESHDWYIFPVYNPDGYVYTFTYNRLWRKTRQRHGISCIGVDPNRNWAYKWRKDSFPLDIINVKSCTDTYPGPYAFSEPEMKQISEYLSSIGNDLIGYISHHSYSQLLLISYGDGTKPDNYNELYAVAKTTVAKIEEVNGTVYETGNIAEVLYEAYGNNVDWVKYYLKTRMTYVYELRDTGKYGFLLPANQIIPTGEEIFAGLVTMIKEFQKVDSNL